MRKDRSEDNAWHLMDALKSARSFLYRAAVRAPRSKHISEAQRLIHLLILEIEEDDR